MNTKGFVERAVAQVFSFFEKATEMRFFLHLLCLYLYVNLFAPLVFKKTAYSIVWSDFEHIPPGSVVVFVITYFALMGYVFRLLYGFLSYFIRFYLSSGKMRWGDIHGMVHEREVKRTAYNKKDSDLIRQLDAHKELCNQDRKFTREMAYLSFVALVFIALSEWLATDWLLDEAEYFVSALFSQNIAKLIKVLLLLPLGVIIWLDASDDYSRDEYLAHEPLYLEIEEERRKEKDMRGY